jgi:hypothetical protein
MPSNARSDRGVALAVAIFALAVVAGLVTGGFGVALLEQQSGRNALFSAQAAEAAEAGLWDLLHALPDTALRSLPVGGAPLDVEPSRSFPGIAMVGQIVRLSDNLFLIRSQAGRIDVGGTPVATRSVGLLARWSADTTDGANFLQPIRERSWLQLY